MIKILILFAIVVLSGCLGIALSNSKKRKFIIYSQLSDFNEKMLVNLKYGKVPVEEVAREYSYVEKCLSGAKISEGEQQQFIDDYFCVLGTTDAKSQIDYLTQRGAQLIKYKQSSEADYKKYGSLYIKICLLAGVLVAVLLA